MNDDRKIIDEFNETFGNKTEPVVQPYRVTPNGNGYVVKNNSNISNNMDNSTTNLMTGYVNENPAFNVVPEVNNNFNTVNNSVNNINSNFVNPTVNSINSNQVGIQNSNTNSNVIDNNQQLYNTTGYINDSVDIVSTKRKKNTVKINPELMTILLLALVLLVAMAFIPTIFDWIDDLKIKIFG